MKKCPACNRTYPDESFAFCLIDGAVLSAPFDPQATQKLPESHSTEATIPSPAPPTTPTMPQVSTLQYEVEQNFAGAGPPGQNTKRRLWIPATIIMLVVIAGILLIIGNYNKTSDSGNNPAASGGDAKQPASNTSEASRLPKSPVTSSQTGSPDSQPSTAPNPGTTVKVKLRMFSEGSGGDFPNEEEVTLKVGAQIFKKMSDSSGYVIFDNVPCGYEITITHEGNKGPNQVIVKSILGCDKPIVDLGMFNQYGKFKNKSYIAK
jgi:hypothetical protein